MYTRTVRNEDAFIFISGRQGVWFPFNNKKGIRKKFYICLHVTKCFPYLKYVYLFELLYLGVVIKNSKHFLFIHIYHLNSQFVSVNYSPLSLKSFQ